LLVEVIQSQNWFHAEAPERCWRVAVMRTVGDAQRAEIGHGLHRHVQCNGILRERESGSVPMAINVPDGIDQLRL